MPAWTSSLIAGIAARRDADVPVTLQQRRGLLEHLGSLADPRDRRGLRHGLVGVLAVTVCAVLSGGLCCVERWHDRGSLEL